MPAPWSVNANTLGVENYLLKIYNSWPYNIREWSRLLCIVCNDSSVDENLGGSGCGACVIISWFTISCQMFAVSYQLFHHPRLVLCFAKPMIRYISLQRTLLAHRLCNRDSSGDNHFNYGSALLVFQRFTKLMFFVKTFYIGYFRIAYFYFLLPILVWNLGSYIVIGEGGMTIFKAI